MSSQNVFMDSSYSYEIFLRTTETGFFLIFKSVCSFRGFTDTLNSTYGIIEFEIYKSIIYRSKKTS